jgi:hypothetical protein
MKKYLLLIVLAMVAASCFKRCPCEERTTRVARFKADGEQFCLVKGFMGGPYSDYTNKDINLWCGGELLKDKTKTIYLHIRLRKNGGMPSLDLQDSLLVGSGTPVFFNISGSNKRYELDTTKPYNFKIIEYDSLKRNITLEFYATVNNGTQTMLLSNGFFDL